MITAIIIDDEKSASDVLQMELEINCPDVNVVAIANDAKAGLLEIKKHKPDIVFLDIDMPWMTGLEMIELLPDENLDIIFVTAHDEYAIQAIKTSALDFLTKPVDAVELKKAVQKIINKREIACKVTQYQFLVEQVKAFQENKVKQIILPSQNGISFVEIRDIIYCKAEDTYSFVYLENGKRLFVSKSLKGLSELLAKHNFYRCHKSYLVNLEKISTYSKTDGGFLSLKDGIQIPLSRSKKQAFIDIMKNLYIA
ncbi:MAG: LytTR family DNA-binding domain-containing protein [Saprospiraceae bacterium]